MAEEKHNWKQHSNRICYLEMHIERTTKACFSGEGKYHQWIVRDAGKDGEQQRNKYMEKSK